MAQNFRDRLQQVAKRRPAGKASQDLAAPKRPNPVRSLINHWWDRLIGAVWSRSLSTQTAQYAANQTARDYLFNSLGAGLWGGLFPILTMVAAQFVGAEQAGMFSMAFVIANLLEFIGMYGVRTYQISDVDEMDSFNACLIHRTLTCAALLGIGWMYCSLRGYAGDMLTICWGTFVFRAVDAGADVFEGRLQQCEKLYLAGISQALRSGLCIALFSAVLFVTRSLPVASIAMAVAAVATLALVTIPLTLFETPQSRKSDLTELKELFVECLPAFLAQFLFALIESVPKFAMEGTLSYDYQLFFNALYFPAQTILMVVALIYKPQLVRLANIWQNPNHRKRFDLIIFAVLGICAGVTALFVLFYNWVGIPLNSLLYAADFEQYRSQQMLMLFAGGMGAAVDFLYQIIMVLRQQKKAVSAYLIGMGVVTLASIVLVITIGFDGAVWAYFLAMAALFGLMVFQYVRVRMSAEG